MRASRSSTIRPISTVSNTAPNAGSDGLPNMAGRLFFDAADEIVHNFLQRGNRWQVHQQGNKAMDVALLDIEIDVEEQHELFCRGSAVNLEQRRSVASNDR